MLTSGNSVIKSIYNKNELNENRRNETVFKINNLKYLKISKFKKLGSFTISYWTEKINEHPLFKRTFLYTMYKAKL